MLTLTTATWLQAQPMGIPIAEFPIPENATGVKRDAADREIRFKTPWSTQQVAEFYQSEMKKKRWKEDYISIASSFGSVDFEKGEREIEIDLDEEDGIVEVTVEGNGLLWSQLEVDASNPKLRLTFEASDFPMLDAQASSRDGSMEMIRYKSRQSIQENIDFFKEKLEPDGWKAAKPKQQGRATQIRFEKGGLYIRLGLWPLTFSDNSGSYDGAGVAIEGTALVWSGRAPSGGVPQRMLREYERSLGKLSPERREAFVKAMHEAREKLMRGEGGETP